jgi:hypothetical protein
MAMFRKPKFDNMEERYMSGQQFHVGNHKFTLTLLKKEPFPTDILHYDWKVTLSDRYEFNAPMGTQNLAYPYTRLGVIIEKLKNAERYQDDYLANAINDKIDDVFREYK